jgi:hypothetical protein
LEERKFETGNWKLETHSRNSKLDNRGAARVSSFQFPVSSFD